ncbi:MAG: hypothetical protein ACNA8W_21020, partial [Bradymonadaceae bacterium]
MDERLNTALLQRRDRYNALFAAAGRRLPMLDPQGFSEHLREVVAPIIGAVPAGRVNEVTDALYTTSLELYGRGLLDGDARQGAIRLAWSTLFPGIAWALAEEPLRVATA